MAKNLVIVESPAKAKTLARYLGRDYQVLASVGHLVDLPKSKLGVDIEHDFAPEYDHHHAARSQDHRRAQRRRRRTRRTSFSRPTRTARARRSPGTSASKIVQQGQQRRSCGAFSSTRSPRARCRRQSSRPRDHRYQQSLRSRSRRAASSIGSSATRSAPLLWKKVRRGLSAGRVQSVAVRMHRANARRAIQRLCARSSTGRFLLTLAARTTGRADLRGAPRSR